VADIYPVALLALAQAITTGPLGAAR